MKHWGKVSILTTVCGLTALLFVACSPNINATTEDSSAQENFIIDDNSTVKNEPNTPTDNTPTPAQSCIHEFGAWTIISNPTCTEVGYRVRYCNCGECEKETIPALDHDFQFTEHDATCTEDGYIEYQCSRCTEHGRNPSGKHAHNHSENPTEIIDKEPTCTETGLMIYKCDICHATIREEIIPPLKHQYDPETHKCACGDEDPDYTAPATSPSPIEHLAGTYWYEYKKNFAVHFEEENCYTCTGHFNNNGQFVEDKIATLYNGKYEVHGETIDNNKTQYYVIFTDDEYSTELGLTYNDTDRTLSGVFRSYPNYCTLTFVEHEV